MPKPRGGLQTLKVSLKDEELPAVQLKTFSAQAYKQDFIDVEGTIFISGVHHANDLGFLVEKGITHVLNCVAHKYANGFEHKFTYLSLRMDDNVDYEIMNDLDVAADFIQESIVANGRTLVHCLKG